ncbi:dihydroneopterin aldolase [Ignavibacteriales bacterium]
MINIIRIKKASFYAYHGVMKEEQRVGGKFEADIDLYINFAEAGVFDDLHKTINYETVYNYLLSIAQTKKSYLIETVSYKICELLFEKYDNLERLIVRVRKNNPPIGGVVDCVEVEIDSTRSEFFASLEKLNVASQS